MRKNIYDVINNSKTDIAMEYKRIYRLFFCDKIIRLLNDIYGNSYTARDAVNMYFRNLNKKLIGRCLDLNDFDECYGYHFSPQPELLSIDNLIEIAEYVANFVNALKSLFELIGSSQELESVSKHIDSCMADIGQKKIQKAGFIIYTENSHSASAVAEIVDEKIAYSVLEYNHYRLKGDLDAKRKILYSFALDIEPQRKKLGEYNSQLEKDLMQMIQKFIRHNNEKNEYIERMDKQELEDAYDDIYQMYLLAKLTLDHYGERKKRVEDLIKRING